MHRRHFAAWWPPALAALVANKIERRCGMQKFAALRPPASLSPTRTSLEAAAMRRAVAA